MTLPQFTHPLEASLVYALIGAALTWYLGSAKPNLASIQPGDRFEIAVVAKIFVTIFFVGLPSVFIFSLPEMTNLRAGIVVTLVVMIICLTGLVVILSTRIEIEENGFAIISMGRRTRYAYSEFSKVSTYRHNITVERAKGEPIVMIPAVFSHTAALYHYLKVKIEGDQNEPARQPGQAQQASDGQGKAWASPDDSDRGQRVI